MEKLEPTIKRQLLADMANKGMNEIDYCKFLEFDINNFRRRMKNQRWSTTDIERLNTKINLI